MKQCPACGRTFRDETLRFCLYDGGELRDATTPAPSPPPQPAGPAAQPQQPTAAQPVPQEPQPSAPFSPAPAAAAQYPPQVPPEYAPPHPQPAPQPQQPVYVPPQPRGPVGSANNGRWLAVAGGMLVVLLLLAGGMMSVVARNTPGAPPARPAVVAQGEPAADGEGDTTDATATEGAEESEEQGGEGEPAAGGDGVAPTEEPAADGDSVAAAGGDKEAITRELTAAVRRAAEVEERAMGELDTAPLSEVYAGEALQTITARMEEMRLAGQTMETKLDRQEFEDFRIGDSGNEAEVDLTEYWTATVYQGSGDARRVVESVNSKPNPQTLELERPAAGDGWVIRRVVFRGGE